MAPSKELVDDLTAEHRALEKVFAGMSEADWDLPTHAPGRMARDRVTHLAHFDEAATLAIADAQAFRIIGDIEPILGPSVLTVPSPQETANRGRGRPALPRPFRDLAAQRRRPLAVALRSKPSSWAWR